jgi:hypothetical protein
VRQAKLAKDKEMQVLYRRRFNQPLWPRVMRESVREDGREAFTGETMGWVLSGESGQSSRCRSRSVAEKAISDDALMVSVVEPRAVGDPMHVETSFDRNLGDLIHARTGPGRSMKAEAER